MNKYYIERRIFKRSEYYKYIDLQYIFSKGTTLYELINTDLNRIMLLGDPGSGKSTEMKALFMQLYKEKNSDHIPLLVSLDLYTGNNLEDYIKKAVLSESSVILEQPKSKLLFLFDEYDQVFDHSIVRRDIATFIKKYPKSKYIISCRNNYYNDEFDKLRFNNYVLDLFNDNDVQKYTSMKLGGNSSKFIDELVSKNLTTISYNPFILNNLCDIFLEDGVLPESQSLILLNILKILIKNDIKNERFDVHQTINHKEIFEKLTYLALVMETLGRNYLTLVEYNTLFKSKYNSILRLVSVIKKVSIEDAEYFQFIHKNFQEFLVAHYLKDVSLKNIKKVITPFKINKKSIKNKLFQLLRIIDLSSVGIDKTEIGIALGKISVNYYRKQINPSWIPVIKYLCEIREQDDLVLYLIEINQYEIVLSLDHKSLKNEIRKEIFNSVLQTYIRKGIYINYSDVNVYDLANFASKEYTVKKLLEYSHATQDNVIRYNMITILGNVRDIISEDVIKYLIGLVQNRAEDNDIKANSLYAMAKLGFNSKNIIDQIRDLSQSGDDFLLSGYYNLLASSKDFSIYEDEFFDAIDKANNTSQLDLSYAIRKGIKRIINSKSVEKVLDLILKDIDMLDSSVIEDNVPLIVSNLVSQNLDQTKIYKTVKQIIIDSEKNALLEKSDELLDYFKKTDTIQKLFTDLYKEGMNKHFHLISIIAADDNIDFLINESLEMKLDDDDFCKFINWYKYHNLDKAKITLKKIINKTGKFKPQPKINYEDKRRKLILRYIEIIFDKDQYFKDVNKILKKITDKNIDSNILRKFEIKNFDNEDDYNKYIVRDLIELFNYLSNPTLTRPEIIQKLDKNDFELTALIRMYNIIRHNDKLNIPDHIRDTIITICSKRVESFDYTKAIVYKDNNPEVKVIALVYHFFMIEFNIMYNEKILTDMLFFDNYSSKKQDYYGISFIEDKLGADKITPYIINNLKKEIYDERVLYNHLEFCARHGLKDYTNKIVKFIEQKDRSIDLRKSCLELLLLLDEDATILESIININDDVLFKSISEILLKRRNPRIVTILHDIIKTNDSSKCFISAILLLPKNDLLAVEYLIDNIIITKKYNSRFPNEDYISEIDNPEAIPKLFELLEFSYKFEDQIDQDKYHSVRAAVQNALRRLCKIDSNYWRIQKKLLEFINQHRNTYPKVKFLHVLLNDLEKTYFFENNQSIKINEAILFINKIFKI